jgi:hypothetical protein
MVNSRPQESDPRARNLLLFFRIVTTPAQLCDAARKTHNALADRTTKNVMLHNAAGISRRLFLTRISPWLYAPNPLCQLCCQTGADMKTVLMHTKTFAGCPRQGGNVGFTRIEWYWSQARRRSVPMWLKR